MARFKGTKVQCINTLGILGASMVCVKRYAENKGSCQIDFFLSDPDSVGFMECDNEVSYVDYSEAIDEGVGERKIFEYHYLGTC